MTLMGFHTLIRNVCNLTMAPRKLIDPSDEINRGPFEINRRAFEINRKEPNGCTKPMQEASQDRQRGGEDVEDN